MDDQMLLLNFTGLENKQPEKEGSRAKKGRNKAAEKKAYI